MNKITEIILIVLAVHLVIVMFAWALYGTVKLIDYTFIEPVTCLGEEI